MSKMVIASFAARTDADMAVQELEKNGYGSNDISIITKENAGAAADRVAATTDGAASGAATGGVLGGLAGLLAGVGIIPAVAGLFFGGPIAALLGATGIAATTISGAVSGATAGGLIGALTGLGVSEETAQAYNAAIEKGGYVLAVPVRDSGNDNPRTIIEMFNAEDVTEVELKKAI